MYQVYRQYKIRADVYLNKFKVEYNPKIYYMLDQIKDNLLFEKLP